MGLFGKKDKSSANAPVARADVQTKTKGKKKKDMMSAILNESVTESAIETMRSESTLHIDREGETCFIGMLLDTNHESFGGLNKKSRKDEDKGQIIELISSGRIATFIPQSLLDEEKLVIIPLMTTLDAMDEFEILTNAHYTIAVTSDDGSVEDTECEASYNDFLQFVMHGGDGMEFLASHGVDWAQDEDFGSADEPYDYEEGDDSYSDDEDPFGDDDGFDESDYEVESDVEEEDIPFSGEDDVEYDDDDADEGEGESVYDEEPPVEDDEDEGEPDAVADEAPIEPDVEVPDEMVEKAITRRFYSDDLGLEVTTEPFDAQFLHANTYVSFDENRGEGWLNNYLNEMSKAANVEMKHLHNTNLFEMREMFYDLLSKHCEQIQRDLDEMDESTQYGQIMSALRETRAERIDDVPSIVSRRRQDIDDAWNRALTQVGEDASRAAQQQYRERYGKQHDEQVFRIEPTIRREIEDEYQDAVREVREERRADASKRLDYGITETLAEVSKIYMERLQNEREVYAGHRKRIADFLDDNRKDDIAHSQALAEELAQSEKADKVMAKYEQELKNRMTEFEVERQRLSADISNTERRAQERIADIKAECDHRVKELRDENEKLNKQVDSLLKKYADLDDKKAREYEARLAEARDEKQAWSDKCDHIAAVHKKSSVFAITAVVVAIIASLAIGVIVGTNMNLDLNTSNATHEIAEEFNQRMDAVEDKTSELEKKQSQEKDKATDDTNVEQSAQTDVGDAASNEGAQ